MKKVILTKISGLFLLGILSVSCSSEDSVTSENSSLKKEEVQDFKLALKDYALNKYGSDPQLASETFNRMAQQAKSYMFSVGISESTIDAIKSENELISKAIIAFAKREGNQKTSNL